MLQLQFYHYVIQKVYFILVMDFNFTSLTFDTNYDGTDMTVMALSDTIVFVDYFLILMAWSLHIFHQKSGYEVFLAHTTDFLMTTDNKIVLLQKTLYFYYFFSFLLMQQLFSVFLSVPLRFVCLFIFPSDLNARVSVYRCDIHTHSLI